MGSGKTTDGRAAANLLRVPFLDLDEEMGRRRGQSAQALIDACGIAEFRRLETELLLRARRCLRLSLPAELPVPPQPEAVIATGSGSVLLPQNREFLLRPGHLSLWLDLPFPLLLQRIRADRRPPLHGLADEEIRQVWLQRLPFYQAACHRRLDAPPFPPAIRSLFRLSL